MLLLRIYWIRTVWAFFTHYPTHTVRRQLNGRTELTYLLTYSLTYLLTPCNRVFLHNLTGFQLVKKFPAFNGTRRFITAFTTACHLSILSQINPIHISTSPFLKIHLSIILPYTPGSSKWSLSFRFPHQNPVYNSALSHTSYMSRTLHYSPFHEPKNIG